jgi:hypothetical protein
MLLLPILHIILYKHYNVKANNKKHKDFLLSKLVMGLYKKKKMNKHTFNLRGKLQEIQMENNDDANHSREKKQNNYSPIFAFLNYLFKIVKFFIGIAGIYIIWIFLHYVASHLYVRFCVPHTLYGFLLSPFLVATPYCIGLRWLVNNGANTIHSMWILLGSWFGSQFAVLTNNN